MGEEGEFMKREIKLQEITEQESGIVIYPDGYIAVVNWAGKSGLPRYMAPFHDPIFMPTDEISFRTEDTSNIVLYLPEGYEVIADKFNDLQKLFDDFSQNQAKVGGRIYYINDEIIVIAPDDWN